MSGRVFPVEHPAPKWRLEIRCCCNPDRLYGWLELDEEPRRGLKLRLPVPPLFWREGEEFGLVTERGEVSLEIERVTVPGEIWRDDPRREFRDYLALKYEEDDRSFDEKARRLRHLRGFTPSPEALAAIQSDPNRSNPITGATTCTK